MADIQMLRPLRHRDFGLLWAGMSISIVGDGAYQVALAWQVYLLSDTPTALSIVGAAATLPNLLFVLFAGILADRFERRKVLIVADLMRGVANAAIGILAITGQLELWHVIASSVVYGVGQSLFGPAFTALVPDLVPKEDLPQANAVDSLVRPLGLSLLGPALGGLLIAATGAGTALLLDAASFGVSIAALALMRPHPLPVTSRSGVSTALADLTEGLAYVRAHTWLWGTLVAACVSLLVFATGGVASIVTSLAFSQRGLPARPVLWMFVSWGLAIVFIAGFGIATELWQAAVMMFIVSGLSTVGMLIWGTLLGTRVPRELLGRVSSLDWLLSIGLVPVSFIATGPVADLIGVSQTLVLAGLLGGAIFSAFLFLPGLREQDTGLPAVSRVQ